MPKYPMRIKAPLFRFFAAFACLALLCAAGSGCAIFSHKDETMLVQESQLNWLEICYLPGSGKKPVQLSLKGSGNILLRRGTSPLISNDFARDIDNLQWADISVDQINVEPAQIRNVMQALVDRGLLREPDKDFLPSASRGLPVARITGSLNNEPVLRIAIEPELTGFIREVLKLFDHNRLAPETRK